MVIALVIMLVVFGVILPQVIDYQTVWETLTSISAASLVVLLVAGLVYYLPEGGLFALMVPGMSWWRGIKAWVASAGVGSTVPALDFVTRFGMYRSWGFSVAESTRGIFLSGAFDWTVKFAMPVVAVLLLIAAGVRDVGFVGTLAAIGALAVTVILGVLIAAVRSERFTRWLVRHLDRLAAWALTRMNRDPVPDLPEQLMQFREDAVSVAGRRGVLAVVASASGKLWQYVMLTLALRAVGVPSDVLSNGQIFVVFSVVLLITMIPLTPGGIGIAELFYIAFFTRIAGPEWSSIVGAGVMLYRVFQWAMPIPIGWTVAVRWRRKVQSGALPDPFRAEDDGAAA